MKYRIGLDVGIKSIGYAVVSEDEQRIPIRIENKGVMIFDVPENLKDGSSLALPRRTARSARRRTRRRKHRIARIKDLLVNKNVITKELIEDLYVDPKFDKSVYELRFEALNRILDNTELVRILIHFGKHRGFKSNRKSETSNTKNDEGKLLNAVQQNKELFEAKGYRTAGEMLFKDEKFSVHKRNKQDEYLMTMGREMLIDEIESIFDVQIRLESPIVDEELKNKYLEIFKAQRPFDLGPGEPSPYAGNQIEKMLGCCTFEPEEKRATKASYTFERFNLLTKINNLRIVTLDSGQRKLSNYERELVLSEAYSRAKFTHTQLRKVLELKDNELFKGLSYGDKEIIEVEKAVFSELKFYNAIKKALKTVTKDIFTILSQEQLDDIGYALTVFKNDKEIENFLLAKGISKDLIELLLPLSFTKTGHLSIKAMKKILPFLEEGELYNEACVHAGYKDWQNQKSSEKSYKLPPVDAAEIRNPVVMRALTQTRKLINAIINKYGSPTAIHIELAREMSKNFKDRQQIKKDQEENRKKNDLAKKHIQDEFDFVPRGLDVLKHRLWTEQDGKCPYSSKTIALSRIFEKGYVDIDHIIPYSRSFDDSYTNKVLVLTEENRQKVNMTPYEYFGNDNKRWDEFEILVKTIIRNRRKRQNLLRKNISEKDYMDMRSRSLNDSKYITRYLMNHINRTLEFADSARKKKVYAINGRVTAQVRGKLGLAKVREDNDVHHALDAILIACIGDGYIQKLSSYYKYNQGRRKRGVWSNGDYLIPDPETGESLTIKQYDDKYSTDFPEPWRYFRDDVLRHLSEKPELGGNLYLDKRYSGIEIEPIFVYRKPRKRCSGAGHKETLRSPKAGEGYTVHKTALTELKLDSKGEIAGYYNPSSDKVLYNALKERLIEFDGNAKKAFADGFEKVGKNGARTPVRKVKITKKSSLNVSLNKGKSVADNGAMLRVDVFKKDGKNYLVPIYVADMKKEKLPSKAIKSGGYEKWVKMDSTYTFGFSLYPDELFYFDKGEGNSIKVTLANGTTKKIRKGYLYYKKTDISNAAITACAHDDSYVISGLGVLRLAKFDKMHVDLLGNITGPIKETRMGFNRIKP